MTDEWFKVRLMHPDTSVRIKCRCGLWADRQSGLFTRGGMEFSCRKHGVAARVEFQESM